MSAQSQANKNKDKLEDNQSSQFGTKIDPDYDPSHTKGGIDAGKPSNPNTPTVKNLNQDDSKLHPLVETDDRLKHSGKHAGGLPNEPIVSVNPTSKPTDSDKYKQEPIAISDALGFMVENPDAFNSIYNDIDVGAGMLITVEPGKTLDQTIFEAHKEVYRLNEFYSVPELNEEGEEMSDQIIVHELKRNDDKTIQLNDKSKPITGASHQFRKRRIKLRQYAVKSVMADGDKISEDGALIVRVF